MATYKPIRKTANGTEEIKIPYAVIADPPKIPTATSDLTNDSGFITSDGTVKSVVDYGDTNKNIKIGYSGAGITGDSIKYIAGYTTGDGTTGNVARIKDISKDALKSWLGKVDNAANADTAGKVANPLTILSSPSGSSIYETFLAYNGSAHKSFMFGTDFWVDQTGTPTVFLNNSGVTAGTYNSVTVDKKGRVTAGTNTPVITADGGTINKSKTVKMDASANSDGANLKWGTVNSKNPYIGYASDQVDGTFVVGSLLGTNYASGLAIGGGSGNLLWKGAKVATTSDIPNISGKVDKSAFSLSGTTLTITI